MKSHALVLATASLLAASTSLASAAGKPAIPKENATIAEASVVVDSFHTALKKGDRKTALNMLDDSVEIFEQGAVEQSKAEYMAHHFEADIAFSRATKMTRKSSGGAMLGNLAYFTSQNTVTGSFNGQPVNSVMIETMVLHKTPAGWKILHIHWSSRAPKGPARETRGAQP